MRSSNPALTGSVFQNFESYGDTTTMTITGTAVKTLIAIVLALLTAGTGQSHVVCVRNGLSFA